MNTIIHVNRDPLLEAVHYLSMLGARETYDAWRDKFLHYCITNEQKVQIEKRIAPIMKLARLIAAHCTPDPQEVQLFFRPFTAGGSTLADMLIYSFYDPLLPDRDSQIQNIRESFQRFASDPAASISKLSLGFDELGPESGSPSHSLCDQLEEAGFADGEKWILYRAIYESDTYITRLLRMLEPIEAIINAHISIFTQQLGAFKRRWESYFKKTDCSVFLLNVIGLDTGDASNATVHIFPALLNGGTFYLRAKDLSGESPFFMRIGIGLDEHFSLKDRVVNSTQISEKLKVLADKSKLNILAYIRDKRAYGLELARETGLSTATISHHMNALVNCGFIHIEKGESRIYYQMDQENVRLFLEQLSRYLFEGSKSQPAKNEK